MNRLFSGILAALVPMALAAAQPIAAQSPALSADKPFDVRVVVTTTFEAGKDTGDVAGELQNWIERYPCNEPVEFPYGIHPMYLNRQDHVLCILTGEGKAHAAATIMALATDPRFNLKKAYWLMDGIAGVDPHAASVGSAVWANYVVEGDLSYEIDGREIPASWSTGILPNDRSTPFAAPAPDYRKDRGVMSYHSPMSYALNQDLTRWAYELTRQIELPDDAHMAAARAAYKDLPKAQMPPSVMIGDTLSADHFWMGERMTGWAEKWVPYWTADKGHFVTTAEEDTGFMQALEMLSTSGKVDLKRVLVLRTASNFCMQPPATDAANFLHEEASGHFSAFRNAVDATWRIGSPVVRELAQHWEKYADATPSAK